MKTQVKAQEQGKDSGTSYTNQDFNSDGKMAKEISELKQQLAAAKEDYASLVEEVEGDFTILEEDLAEGNRIMAEQRTALQQAQREIEGLRKALEESISLIDGLAGQQAMSDDWYEKPLAKIKSALRSSSKDGV